ncbi:MAG: hypothetical protein LBL49_01765 [Clostridiales Family XIII bacterium]|nr:hypothetical protein [Clostridiales Family XIII bacterium]
MCRRQEFTDAIAGGRRRESRASDVVASAGEFVDVIALKLKHCRLSLALAVNGMNFML